jgi:hypothetical protein
MSKNTDLSTTMNKLEAILHEYLVVKAPALPTNIKDVLVAVAPWLTLVMVVLSLPVILGAIGLSAFLAPFGMMAGVSTGFGITTIILLVVIVLEALSIPGLFNKTQSGWNLLYYATLVSAIYSLFNRDIIGLIFGTLLSLYILFQVKSYYK